MHAPENSRAWRCEINQHLAQWWREVMSTLRLNQGQHMSICFQEVQALKESLASYSIWIKHLHLLALDNKEKWGLLNITLFYKWEHWKLGLDIIHSSKVKILLKYFAMLGFERMAEVWHFFAQTFSVGHTVVIDFPLFSTAPNSIC